MKRCPKYINTRETLIYHKGSLFLDSNSAKEEIKKENIALLLWRENSMSSLLFKKV